MEKKSVSMIDFYIKIVFTVMSGLSLLFVYRVSQLPVYGIYIIFLSIYLLVKSHKNIFTFIATFFLFWSNYSIVVANYFTNLDSLFLCDSNDAVSIVGLKIICLFTTVLILLIGNYKIDTAQHLHIRAEESGHILIAIGYLLILIYILVFGFVRPNTEGERGSPSAMYEYSIIFFIVGSYYFFDIKIYKIISVVLMLLYALQNTLYGGRVTALQELLIIYILFFQKTIKPNVKKILPLAITGFIIFSTIGIFRASTSFSSASLTTTANTLAERKLTLDTAYSSFFTSLTFIKTENILNFVERMSIFRNWCLSMIIGGSAVPNCNLAMITYNYYYHCYGGVLPFFGHFYFGYIGVIFYSVVISVYMNALYCFHNKSDIIKCVLFYIAVTTPRWYLYSPSNLFRGSMLVIILFIATKGVNELLVRRQKNYVKK